MSGQRADHYTRTRVAFTVAHISDTQWRKVFTAIATVGLDVNRAEWKSIDDERVYDWGLPAPADLGPDRRVDGRSQPVEYKWIEWLRFTRRACSEARATPGAERDLAGLLRVLRALGQLQLEYDANSLTMFGYSRSSTDSCDRFSQGYGEQWQPGIIGWSHGTNQDCLSR